MYGSPESQKGTDTKETRVLKKFEFKKGKVRKQVASNIAITQHCILHVSA